MTAHHRPRPSGIVRFRDQLPLSPEASLLTLGEGNTPLVPSTAIGPALGLKRLFFKLESSNPTGSYKDRIAMVAINRALQRGVPALIGTSSGNAGASMAAYASRAGLPFWLFVVDSILPNKLSQLQVYGAQTVAVKDFGLDPEVSAAVFEQVQQLAVERGWDLLITAYAFAAEAMEGVKTISYEICEELGEAPDWAFFPVGGGGLLAGAWRGFCDAEALGLATKVPKMGAIHPEGVPFLGEAFAAGTAEIPVQPCTSAISGLQVPRPPDAERVLEAVRSSNGSVIGISDALAFQLQQELVRKEGILCEPAGATALAGLIQAVAAGQIDPNETLVCCITGHGLKDMSAGSPLVQGLPAVEVVTASEVEAVVSRQI